MKAPAPLSRPLLPSARIERKLLPCCTIWWMVTYTWICGVPTLFLFLLFFWGALMDSNYCPIYQPVLPPGAKCVPCSAQIENSWPDLKWIFPLMLVRGFIRFGLGSMFRSICGCPKSACWWTVHKEYFWAWNSHWSYGNSALKLYAYTFWSLLKIPYHL